MGGLLGLIYAVACIVAIVDCLKSGKETKDKVIWILVTLLLPYIGVILYFVIGKKK